MTAEQQAREAIRIAGAKGGAGGMPVICGVSGWGNIMHRTMGQ